jgi:hypothetical protein
MGWHGQLLSMIMLTEVSILKGDCTGEVAQLIAQQKIKTSYKGIDTVIYEDYSDD